MLYDQARRRNTTSAASAELPRLTNTTLLLASRTCGAALNSNGLGAAPRLVNGMDTSPEARLATPNGPIRLPLCKTGPSARTATFSVALLRVAERDEAEDVLTISPLERGALIHDILDTFFRTVASSETSFDQWSNKHQQTLASIADSKMDFAERRGVTGRDLLWKRERELIQNDLQALLKHDNTRRDEHKLVQIESEFTFGPRRAPHQSRSPCPTVAKFYCAARSTASMSRWTERALT